jgi:hypothetical protein
MLSRVRRIVLRNAAKTWMSFHEVVEIAIFTGQAQR